MSRIGKEAGGTGVELVLSGVTVVNLVNLGGPRFHHVHHD